MHHSFVYSWRTYSVVKHMLFNSIKWNISFIIRTKSSFCSIQYNWVVFDREPKWRFRSDWATYNTSSSFYQIQLWPSATLFIYTTRFRQLLSHKAALLYKRRASEIYELRKSSHKWRLVGSNDFWGFSYLKKYVMTQPNRQCVKCPTFRYDIFCFWIVPIII